MAFVKEIDTGEIFWWTADAGLGIFHVSKPAAPSRQSGIVAPASLHKYRGLTKVSGLRGTMFEHMGKESQNREATNA